MSPLPAGFRPASLHPGWNLVLYSTCYGPFELGNYDSMSGLEARYWIMYTVMSLFSCGSVDFQPDASTSINAPNLFYFILYIYLF